jgi:hypothetical protein
MATVSAAWLTKGYFVLRNDGLMRDVRDILGRIFERPPSASAVTDAVRDVKASSTLYSVVLPSKCSVSASASARVWWTTPSR